MFKPSIKDFVLIFFAVAGVIVVAVLFFFGSNASLKLPFAGGGSSESIAKTAVDYLNENILKNDGREAILEGVSEESGVVKLKLTVGGNSFESYLTKDGKILFPEALKIGENPQGAQNNAAPPQDLAVAENDHIRGESSAKLTLFEYSDFECPFCSKFSPSLDRALKEYKGEIKLVYRHFPLSSIHPNAQKAAEASECASEQGKFWEYHDKLFEKQAEGFGLEKFKKWAVDLGLDGKKFNECLDSSKYASRVGENQQDGVSRGVAGTPATFIAGQLASGNIPYETLKQKIEEALNGKN